MSASASSTELFIVINNYKFTLLRKTSYNARYSNVVNIRSSIYQLEDGELQDDTTFWVYRSNSELGFWRLCSENGSNPLGSNIFFKGTDYVQSTFVYLELQNFININLDNIIMVTLTYKEKEKECFCPNFGSRDDTYLTNCNTSDMYENIINEDRIIMGEEPFKYMQDLDTRGDLGCGLVNRGTTQINFNIKMNEFSRLFEELYIAEESIKLFPYQFNFENIINIIGDVYSIKLNKKIPDESRTNSVILYFLAAEFKVNVKVNRYTSFNQNISRICGKPMHIVPIFLTTNYASIDKYGLYTHYIPCGAFICKMFDYAENQYTQCTVEEIRYNRCTAIYSYIGHRYDNLFPLNIVLANLSRSCSITLPPTPPSTPQPTLPPTPPPVSSLTSSINSVSQPNKITEAFDHMLNHTSGSDEDTDDDLYSGGKNKISKKYKTKKSKKSKKSKKQKTKNKKQKQKTKKQINKKN